MNGDGRVDTSGSMLIDGSAGCGAARGTAVGAVPVLPGSAEEGAVGTKPALPGLL